MPRDGGFKYNPPHGGPAGEAITGPIQARANDYLSRGLSGVQRIPHAQALRADTTHRHDYRAAYVGELDRVIDMEAIRNARVRMAVDPMGGAGVHYWQAIAERWRIDLNVLNEVVDPTFRFMTLDWDGQIRMDPSSSYAMVQLVAIKDRFDIAFACDTDDVGGTALAGEPIQSILTRAPGNDAPIGGIKVSSASGWFAARPSGTENIYKIYAESFEGPEHLEALLKDAQGMVDRVIA